jgi:hypothetical protein
MEHMDEGQSMPSPDIVGIGRLARDLSRAP